MSKFLTFLQLSQEFGGTKFGPFEVPEIRLGSDPDRNDITLPEALGVSPEHVKILKQGDDSFIVAPIDRTTTVFIYRVSGGKPKMISTPVALMPGDGFSLVTEEGPRFYIVSEMAKKANLDDENLEGPGLKGGAGPKAKGILNEIKRRGFAKVLTTGMGNQANRAWTFVKTGQLFSPIYIVGAMTALSGFLFAGGTTCAAFSLNTQKQTAQADLSTCQDQLGVAGSDDPNADPTVPMLTQRILNEKSWEQHLEDDMDFRQAYAAAMRSVYGQPQDYEWVFKNDEANNPYADFKKALEGAGVDERVSRVLSYMAAIPAQGGQRVDFSFITDSESKEICGRGPLQLTFRQAKNLGLYDIFPDAQVPRNVAAGNNLVKQAAALQETADLANWSEKFKEEKIRVSGSGGAAPIACIYIEGNVDDERNDVDALANAIYRTFNDRKRKMPQDGQPYWTSARIMTLYSADFVRGFDDFTVKTNPAPSLQMKINKAITDSRQNYVMNSAAEVLARSVAIPCMATLDKGVAESPPKFMGELPKLGNCAILKAFVDFDRL
jgi:hypothetical protein